MSERRMKGGKGRGVITEVFGDMPLPERVGEFGTDYEAYWQERLECGVLTSPAVRRAAGVLDLITDGDTVLDIGCGTGETLDFLREHRAIRGTGLDISETALREVASKGFETIRMDLSKQGARLDGEYDHVIMFELVEHLVNPEMLLCSVRSSFRKGLYITTPNLGYVAHRLRMLFGRFPVTYIGDPREHLRYWTVRDFRTWARWLGMGIPGVRGLRGKARMLARIHPSLWASEVLYVFRPEG